MLESLATALSRAAARDFRAALTVILSCGPLLRALTPGTSFNTCTSSDDDSLPDDYDNDDACSDAGSVGAGGGILNILRALVQSPGAATSASESLSAAGIDDDFAGRVDSALALSFGSSRDLVRSTACVYHFAFSRNEPPCIFCRADPWQQ